MADSDEEKVDINLYNTGINYEYKGPSGQNKFITELDYHIKSKTHMWIVAVSFRVADSSLDTLDTEQFHLDAENILSADLGCSVCEEPYTPALRKRSCKGEPKEPNYRGWVH